ncbi:hypothetical protein DM02DRAFT_615133 [Periconia macrospinosa]|uniref:Uncharacterized protein n=1 Tax=Periconia macrospinosa TaxID=97972 RepID=A0A2V1DMF1_9PLEO|nr:hypothetical protein DM02DRAFT_615133 [Periconia macrospinosa]
MAIDSQTLGPALLRHLSKHVREAQDEQDNAYKELAQLKAKLRHLDAEIGLSKRGFSLDGSTPQPVEELIKQRKHTHIKKMLPKSQRYEGAKKSLLDLNKTIDAAVLAYSKSSYLDFSTQFYEKLPRELRDMCYGYLISSEIVQQIAAVVVYQANTIISYSRKPLRPPSGAVHLVDTSFSHPIIAGEILELASAASRAKVMQNTLYLKDRSYINRLKNVYPFDLGISASDMAGTFDLESCFVEAPALLMRLRNMEKEGKKSHRDYQLLREDFQERLDEELLQATQEMLQIQPRKYQYLSIAIPLDGYDRKPSSWHLGAALDNTIQQMKKSFELVTPYRYGSGVVVKAYWAKCYDAAQYEVQKSSKCLV